MKNLIQILTIIILSANYAVAQNNNSRIYEKTLPIVYVTEDVNVMFRSPEPIQFVDLSSDKLVADLPTNNVSRLKILKYDEEGSEMMIDSIPLFEKKRIDYIDGENVGVVTIIAQSFMAQYKLIYVNKEKANQFGNVTTDIQIINNDMKPLELEGNQMSDIELKEYSQRIIKKGREKKVSKNQEFLIESIVNNIYTLGDYIFIDVSFKNKSELNYDVGNVEFSIADKKIFKATNNQTLDLEPSFQLYPNNKFRKDFRNIYVFKKFTFPNDKVFRIRIYENGISGRTLTSEIKY